MSAVAGVRRLGGNAPTRAECDVMLEAQRIYGPDAAGSWSDGYVTMGRRLARLLPEDEFDRQPLRGAGGRFTLVADVRLDNRSELSAALGMEHSALSSMSDADLLLAAWARWGEDSCTRLFGDFAFAVYDADQRSITLVRDSAGMRPLCFHISLRLFAFASMPKGLHALPDIVRAPDLAFARKAVTNGFPPKEGSWFLGIERVLPGQMITLRRDGSIQSRRWWNPPDEPPILGRGSDYAESLSAHLDAATRCRLRGADRLAAQLSGGLDSSAVVTSAARQLAPGRSLVAFTSVPRAGYQAGEAGILTDEGPLAAATAAAYPNIDHVRVTGDGTKIFREMDRYVELFEQPTTNLCNMPWITAIAAGARERHIRVVLTGQYGNFTFSYDGRQLIGSLAQRRRWAELAGHFIAFRHSGLRAMAGVGAAAVRALRAGPIPSSSRQTRLEYLEWLELGNFMKGQLGGWGVDCRDPLADRRLVEFSLAAPEAEYLRGGVSRSLARRALVGRVPAQVVSQRYRAVQAPDWHEGATAEVEQLQQRIAQIEACPAAAELVDTGKLRELVRRWPSAGWHEKATSTAYRLGLLRKLSMGHFIAHASGVPF